MAGDVPSPAPVDPAEPGAPEIRLALYRKYRPATFAELKGQDHVTEPLRQALRSGRVNHAYLFSGPRGCGKTSSARILARSLNCEQGPTPDPCGKCASCVALAPSGPGSIDVIEIDAASHGGVDDARDLRERAFYAPVSARFKIYIIDEAHMVTGGGFNALLKLVEEPPPHLKFVFATTEPEKVIPTIRSRTHHYPFRLVPPGVLRELLAEILASEGVGYEPAVLPVVVRAGAGSARDSLSILDQLLAGSGPEGLTYQRAIALLGHTDAGLLDEVTDAFAAGDGAAIFHAVDRVIEGGHEPRRFAADLLDRLRDLIVLAAVPDAAETGLLDAPADRVERMRNQAAEFGQARLARAAEVINAGLVEMRGATSPRLLLELMCAQVLLPGAATGERAMMARLEALEHRLAAGTTAGAAGGGQPEADPDAAVPPERKSGRRAPETAARPAGTTRRAVAAQQADDASLAAGRPPAAGDPLVTGGGPAAGGPHAEDAPAAATAGNAPAASTPASAASTPAQRAPRTEAAGRAGTDGTKAAAGSGAEAIADRWPEILEAVKRERKVAWILLGNATVDSVSDGVLTLRFAREGEAKGFTGSGCDQDLARVLQAMLGIAVQIRTTAGATGSGSPGGRAGSGGQAGPDDGYAGSGSYAGTSPAAGRPDRGGQQGQQAAAGRPAGGHAEAARRQQPPSRLADDFPEDPGPYDGPPGGPVSDSDSLTGLDLIERELGGKVIEELGG
jgi:DNA polymerase III subunit gamma/tau